MFYISYIKRIFAIRFRYLLMNAKKELSDFLVIR